MRFAEQREDKEPKAARETARATENPKPARSKSAGPSGEGPAAEESNLVTEETGAVSKGLEDRIQRIRNLGSRPTIYEEEF